MKDTIYREDAIESMAKAIWNYPNELYPCLNSYEHAHDLAEQGLKFLPPAEPKPAIPLSWIEWHIKWLKSLDNAFSTLTAVQISAMVNKWRGEQND